MSQVDVQERLRAFREQALRRPAPPDAWPRLQRRLRREPWRRAALIAGLALAVLVASVVPGLLTRRAGQAPAPAVDAPIAPGRPVVAARIRLDRPFADVDVGYGAVWLTGQGVLRRIDPRTNRVVTTIPTPLTDRYASVAFGEGSVWVTSGSQAKGVVYRVDPAANRVTAAISVPGGAFGIVVAAATAWVTQLDPDQPSPGPGVVARIDARSGQLLAPVQVPSMPLTIRYGLDAIWVTSSGHPPPNPVPGGVSRIDPRSGTITGHLGSVGNVMAVGGGALWGTFANSAEDSGVQRVDPATGRVVATVRIPYGVLMAFGLGTLWVAQDAPSVSGSPEEPAKATPGKLYRIDPASNRVLGRPVPLPGIAPTAVAVGEGAVWVGELDRKTLTRFNLVA
jgi:DNA-binding beta-propeller fold protein YncE